MKELGDIFTDTRSIHKAYTGEASKHRENLGEKKYFDVASDLFENFRAVETLEPETIFAIIKAFQIDIDYYYLWMQPIVHITAILENIGDRLESDNVLNGIINKNLQDLLQTQVATLKELRLNNPKALYNDWLNDELSLTWRLILSTITYILDHAFL